MAEALKILAVDDNPSIRESMRFIFEEPRYRVTGAEDGDEALATLELNPQGYDVIIVDQKMPQLTGVELVRGIRERGIAGKIMVLSAHLSPEIREAYKRMDVQVLLDKPFGIEELRLAVNRLAA
jgi:CheY-like chemotaxis protein